jgi:hypothetical protein
MIYYICPNCGTTYKDKDFDDLHYGLCWCKYISYYWDNDYLQIESSIDRVFVPCVEISKKWFRILDNLPNQFMRLSYFNAIPKQLRCKK